MTEIIRSIKRLQEIRNELLKSDKTIGFVPTMGALHAGHASLLDRSRKENDISILSIFVNPTQFDDPKDLKNYPQTLEADSALAQKMGVAFIFVPTAQELYNDQYRYRVNESELSRLYCGAHRPGHFDGVLTVVLKLLMIVRAHRAYFGEKDFQQMKLVQGMTEAFFIDTEIVPCPIVRDEHGLALSSRNVRLTHEDREKALKFAGLLNSDLTPQGIRVELEKVGVNVDYIDQYQDRRLGAVRIGNTRLIDNVRK